MPNLAPKIPNFCMWLAWDIMNNFLNCADIEFPTETEIKSWIRFKILIFDEF
jgi:hypothetical protein